MVTLLATSAVDAKPLPKGVSVSVKKGAAVATIDGTTVSLAGDTLKDWQSISAELSDDGDSIVAMGKRCHGSLSGEATKTTVPLAVLQARAENQAGLALLAKGKLADAEGRFSAALALDDQTPEYATNLLVAQVKAKEFDAADRTLAAEGKRFRGYFAWRLLVDRALKPMLRRASAAPFSVPRGNVRAVNLHVAVAYSKLGLVASRTNSGIGTDVDSNPLEVSVADTVSGKELFRIPIKNKAQIAAADALLQKLGLDYEGTLFDVSEGRSMAGTDGRAILVGTGHAPRLQINGREQAISIPDVTYVGFVPAAAVVIAEHHHVYACDDQSFRMQLYTLKTP